MERANLPNAKWCSGFILKTTKNATALGFFQGCREGRPENWNKSSNFQKRRPKKLKKPPNLIVPL